MPVTLTPARFEELRTLKGGLTRATINALGVPRPLIQGWPQRLIGTTISDQQWEEARAGREKLIKSRNTPAQEHSKAKPAPAATYTPVIGMWFGQDGQLVLDTGSGKLLTISPDRVAEIAEYLTAV